MRTDETRIAILGAGMSGLCMGIQLKRAGIHAFTIFEKADAIGGTWRDNTYPGCACDVPSHLYSYSFEREPGWSRMFAEQPEILRYFEKCAERHDLLPHIRLSTEVVEAAFDETKAVWHLRTASGEQYDAQVLVCACGQLNRPRYPDVPGQGEFRGTMFHSARWDHAHDLSGEAVAVVGNAASAVQLVPRIAPSVRALTVFQRSANWIIRKPDRTYTRFEKWLFDRLPGVERAYRNAIYWQLEARFVAFSRTSWIARLVERSARKHLEEQVPDPELRRALTPDYPLGCKRILISNDYYPSLMRPNVRLVTSPIERITERGLITRDGEAHSVDTIILATGFESTSFLAPMDVRGRGNRSLREAWRDGAEAYLGVAVSGFPNLFLLYGPNTNLGHNSIIYMVEAQVRYAVECIKKLVDEDLAWMDVREDVMDAYNRDLQTMLQSTVWSAECGSWYKTSSGKITNNWPDFTYRYGRRMRRPDPSHFETAPRP